MTSKKPPVGTPSPPYVVQALNRQRRYRIFLRSVESYCKQVLATMGVHASSLAVVFVGPRKMRSLNHRYRGRDYATDVLSFRYRSESQEGINFLGEIVIAPEVAREQSLRWGSAPEREI